MSIFDKLISCVVHSMNAVIQRDYQSRLDNLICTKVPNILHAKCKPITLETMQRCMSPETIQAHIDAEASFYRDIIKSASNQKFAFNADYRSELRVFDTSVIFTPAYEKNAKLISFENFKFRSQAGRVYKNFCIVAYKDGSYLYIHRYIDDEPKYKTEHNGNNLSFDFKDGTLSIIDDSVTLYGKEKLHLTVKFY